MVDQSKLQKIQQLKKELMDKGYEDLKQKIQQVLDDVLGKSHEIAVKAHDIALGVSLPAWQSLISGKAPVEEFIRAKFYAYVDLLSSAEEYLNSL